MTDLAATWAAELEARALAALPDVMAALLNNVGWPTGDARNFNRKAPRRRFRFHVDGDGAWVEGAGQRVEQRGKGMIALVAAVTATQPERAAEVLAVVLQRLGVAVDDRPMTATAVKEYRDLRRALNRRRRDLGMSMSELDAVSGLPDGYAAKLLGGMRHIGELSMPCILGALKLELIVKPLEHKEQL